MTNPLRDYISDAERTERLAAACQTKPVYLRHLAFGHRRASPALAIAIETHSGGVVPRHSLRPDLWTPPAQAADAQAA